MKNSIKIHTFKVWGQAYLLPYIKITKTRDLNGDLEFIVGWFNYGISFSI